MNITQIPQALGVLRKGRSFVDSVKSGKQVAITAALGVLLAAVAPFIGGEINVHPWLAYFFTEQGIQVLGAVIAGASGLVYHFGASPDRGLPAKPVDAAPVAGQPRNPSEGEQGPLDTQSGAASTDTKTAPSLRVGPTSDDPARGDLSGGP